MTSEELLILAMADPHGYSGQTFNDGTPMTNLEYYKENKKFS